MQTILTIAGSDSIGGAGIQADIKTITTHHLYAMSAITALTAQNTTGVYGIMNVPPDFIGKQLDAIFNDIRPDAVKIGMLSNSDAIAIVAEKLQQYKAKNIVLDPVMVATSGAPLLETAAIVDLRRLLLPLARVITPNIPEAQLLCDATIEDKAAQRLAAAELYRQFFAERHDDCGVLIKGGHFADCADDLLFSNNGTYLFESKKIDNPNTHGTGCTLSSAIACNLATGYDLHDSIQRAKAYISAALNAQLNLGKGNGPLNHFAGGSWLDTLDI